MPDQAETGFSVVEICQARHQQVEIPALVVGMALVAGWLDLTVSSIVLRNLVSDFGMAYQA